MSDQAMNVRDLPLSQPTPASPETGRGRRPAPRRDLAQRLRAMGLWGSFYQVLVVAAVIALALYLFGNMQSTLAARGMSTGFGFLGNVAGFSIGESIIPFGSQATFADAFLVG